MVLVFEEGFTLLEEDDSHDEAIDAENTSHDNGYDGLHDHLWLENTHGGNANA